MGAVRPQAPGGCHAPGSAFVFRKMQAGGGIEPPEALGNVPVKERNPASERLAASPAMAAAPGLFQGWDGV